MKNERKLAVRWESYIRDLQASKSPQKKMRWYAWWAERFERFLKEKPLHEAVRDNANDFISSLGSLPHTESWQLRQADNTIRVLLTGVFGKSWVMGTTDMYTTL